MNFFIRNKTVLLFFIFFGSCSSSIKYIHKSLYWKNTYKIKIITHPRYKLYLSSENGTVFDTGEMEPLNDSVLIMESIGKESIFDRDSMIVGVKDIIERDTLIVRKKYIYSISNYNEKTGEYKMR